MATSPIAIAIHGGAGILDRKRMSADIEQDYRQKLEESVQAGYDVLQSGGNSSDAVVAAVQVMENSELFNAGKGSVFTHDEQIEMDASIMEGRQLQAGAIAGVKHISNPIQLAQQVMNHSEHVLLIGEGAESFATEQHFTLQDNDYFKTERRLQQLRRVQRSEAGTALSEDSSDEFSVQDKKLGTVGAVAIDEAGDISAATSTGGMTNKKYGRVGDSPVIGAGTYADNRYGAVSATGHGEYFIRLAVAYDICARVAYKQIPLQQAADEVVCERLMEVGGDGGIVAIDPAANIVFSFNSPGMYRASIDQTGELYVAIFAD